MIDHYITSAIREFSRTPLTVVLNIFGLALGLACFILAIGVSRYWSMSDAHFANADRTYVLLNKFEAGELRSSFFPDVSIAAGYYLREDFPAFDAVARITDRKEVTVIAGQHKAALWSAAAEQDLLKIFDFQFVEGSATGALAAPDKAIITEKAAKLLFGDSSALGKEIRISDSFTVTVAGVIATIPEPSHFGGSEQAYVRFDLLYGWNPDVDKNPNWSSSDTITYLLFPKSSEQLSPKKMEAQLDAFIQRRIPEQQRSYIKTWYQLLPLSGFQSRIINLNLFKGRPEAISVMTMLALLGILVLIVSCINYANLASVQAATRGKEVGMRKILGAGRKHIFFQYWTEAILFTAIAAAAALFFFWAAGPLIKNLAHIDMRMALFTGSATFSIVFLLIIIVSFVSCLYPVVILSRVRPACALRSGSMRAGPKLVMRALVGVQFAITGSLLIILLVVTLQNAFLRHKSLGQADPIVILKDEDSKEIGYEALNAAFSNDPRIMSVTQLDYGPFSNIVNLSQYSLLPFGEGAVVSAFESRVGLDFFKTFDAKILAGRVFDRARNEAMSLVTEENQCKLDNLISIVVDRAFIEQMGISRPDEAIGRRLYLPTAAKNDKYDPIFEIIGVIEPMPLVFSAVGVSANVYEFAEHSDPAMVPIIKLSRTDVVGGLDSVHKNIEARVPGALVNIVFLDEAFDRGFQTYSAINAAFVGLSFIALAIAILGLFAMASYVAARRQHEIGVRKTLGASTRSIIILLLRDFSQPVVIGNLIAWPVGYFAARIYLDNFVQKIELSIWPWIAGMALMLAIAWLAVGGQAIRAALINPAHVLRYE